MDPIKDFLEDEPDLQRPYGEFFEPEEKPGVDRPWKDDEGKDDINARTPRAQSKNV